MCVCVRIWRFDGGVGEVHILNVDMPSKGVIVVKGGGCVCMGGAWGGWSGLCRVPMCVDAGYIGLSDSRTLGLDMCMSTHVI